MDDIFKIAHEISVKVDKATNEAVLGQIVSIAKENGITQDEIILNEKAITLALMKSQKRKVYFDREFYLNCPQCNGIGVEKFKGYKPKYCPDCGQALDWEVQ